MRRGIELTLDITEEERDYLLELLEAKRSEMLHELHHTDTLDYKEMLRRRMALAEGLRSKVEGAGR
ncbi:MAG: hypothetical protein JOZ02_16050 [Acidobacteria bacterium]|nr:hypothetical protein [Acidobacteriota bacterium]